MEQPNETHGGRDCSVPDEAAGEAGAPGGTAGARLHRVGAGHRPQAGVDTEPAQRLRLPARRAVVHPRQVHEIALPLQHQVGKGTPGEVGGVTPSPT